MSSINFEKATGKEYLTHKQVNELVEKHRDKKLNKLKESRKERAKNSYSSNNHWTLPSVEKAITQEKKSMKKRTKSTSDSSESSDSSEDVKDAKQKKYKKNKSNKESKKRRERASSTTSDSSEDGKDTKRKKRKKSKNGKDSRKRRERASSTNSDSSDKHLPNQSHGRERDDWMTLESIIPTYKKERVEKEKRETSIIAAPGQSSRELNPYWKDGGSGIPLNAKEYDMKKSVGDKGLEWYERALKRAQETASEEGRSLADVVSERWGSLQNLTDLITNAKAEKQSCSKPRLQFQKPGSEFGRFSDTKNSDRHGNWSKNSEKKIKVRGSVKTNEKDIHNRPERCDFREEKRSEDKPSSSGINKSLNEPSQQSVKILNDDELNKLAAKLVKAEILGKSDQVVKLKEQLDGARAARQAAIEATSAGVTSDETVVLVQSNSKGLARPYQRPSLTEPSGGRRKKKNAETHRDGERVRYFPDDDQRDLKQMFETEKFGSHDEDKAMFLKLASKHAGADVEEDDAAFADVARVAESTGKHQQRDLHQAVKETEQRHRKLENCRLCFGSEKLCKNLIVSLGKKSYLCLPATPLTSLHCQVVPLEHYISGTQLDEDVWEEINTFRLSLISMAKALNHYAIFFEDAREFRKLPHMIMQCVLIDKKDGELAPIYFKKALLDCEGEWTTNKKVVDIKGSDIRGTIPKGLPYFSVEFPPDKGFAHVIENEDHFPSNFAQSVIGGMLDIDHRLWRNPKKDKNSAMAQRERTIAFSRKFLKYDFNYKPYNSSSSSSSTSSDSDSE